MRTYALLAAVSLVLSPVGALALDQPLGHRVSLSRYGGGTGVLFRMVAKANRDGNPASFPIPSDPTATTNLLTVGRDGGALTDDLSAGTWKGLGNPAGSKGWKYSNPGAPTGGEVKILLIKATTIKIVARGTGTMPAPASPVGDLTAVLEIGMDRYCAEGDPPHDKVLDGRLLKTKWQGPPSGCPTPCGDPVDSDGDRIDDCFETNTGIFVDDFDTGTDPNDADTDDDGIEDGDEVYGTVGGLDLPGLGVSPLKQDILVEYDWFVDGTGCASHSHEPSAAALGMVTAMFASAPVSNPDGTTGINFIHDVGQGGVLSGGSEIPDANGYLVGGVDAAEFQSKKAAHFNPNREGYFHYTVLPHRYNTTSNSSGQAELFGDDMIVSLQCSLSNSNVANTIAHELGHNLGLFHGGNLLCNYKPNYNSIMNYLYQFPGVDSNCTPPGDGVLDYSHGTRLSLDENDLDENVGVCGAPSWDWNGNTVIESGISLDLNPLEDFPITCGGALATLTDFNDWAAIDLSRVVDGDGAVPRSRDQIVDCENPLPRNP